MLRTILPTLALCIVALTSTTGCVSGPSVSVHHADVRGGSADGLGVVVYLAVDNANDFDVEIRRVRARVTMEGRYHLAPIDVSPNKWLRANKRTLVAVPMSIPWSVVPRLLSSSAGSSSIAYNVRGTADVTAGRSARVRRNDVAVDEDGRLPRRLVVNAARGSLPF
jgi:hypothetical protein